VSIDIRAGLNGHPAFASPDLTPLPPQRLLAAKYAYTTRYVERAVAREPRGYLLHAEPDQGPRPGDVVLAEVVRLGQHKRLESPVSRRAQMYPGDEIVVAYGHRYAPDQFEAEVPDDLGEAHLVAAGGVVGLVTATKDGLEEPTVVQPLGLLHHAEGRLSLADLAPLSPMSPLDLVAPSARRCQRPRVVALVGTSMNSGKSTALACLVRGLTRAGMRVAAGKATGTGAGGDPGMFRDAGASRVLDFTDFGYASTYRLEHPDVRAVFASLVCELAGSGVDAVVVEVADGAYQAETARLLADPVFTEYVDQVVFTAGDALSAVAGVQAVRRHGIEVCAVSGRLTSAPLATREARAALDVPVVDTPDLCEPEVAVCLLPTPGPAAA
jgi:molybdopterin-guanine dinucleotide biosynthesis protein